MSGRVVRLVSCPAGPELAAVAVPGAPPRTAAAGERVLSIGLAVSVVTSLLLGSSVFRDLDGDSRGMQVFGVLLALVAAWIAVTRPFDVPTLVLAYLPFNMVFPVLMGPGVNLTNILLACAGLAWARTAVVTGRGRPRWSPLELLIMTWILVATIAHFASGMQYNLGADFDFWLELKTCVSPLFLCLATSAVLRHRGDLLRLMVAFMTNTTVIALLTWYQGLYQSSGTIEGSRVKGIMGQPNSMAAFLVYDGLPLLAWFLSSKRPRWGRVLGLAGFLAVMRAILFAFSRGAYLAVSCGAALMVLLRSPVLFVLALAGGGTAVTMFPEVLPRSVVDRVAQTNAGGDGMEGDPEQGLDKSAADRLVLWRAGLAMVKDNPVFGVGLGRFPWMVDLYATFPLEENGPRDAHNAYLLVAATQGLVVLGVMLLALGALGLQALALLRRPGMMDRALSLAVVGSLAGLLISCCFGSRCQDEALVGNFWIQAGALAALGRFGPQPGTSR